MDELIEAALDYARQLEGKSVIASTDDLLRAFSGPPKPKPVLIIPKPIKVETPPPPPSPAPKKEPPKVEKKRVELQLPSVPTDKPKSGIGQFFAEIFPGMRLHEAPPADLGAKRVKEAWKEQFSTPDVAILCNNKRVMGFLKNVAKAIDLSFFPCRVIEVDHLERENKWDLFLDSPNLKWVIAPDSTLWSCKKLMPLFKEYPKQNTRFLGKIPLLLLPDINLYFKDPFLKRSLWNLLCQTLSPPSS
jgi:hypothetical protein